MPCEPAIGVVMIVARMFSIPTMIGGLSIQEIPTMPNYVSHQLIVTGPEGEVQRFHTTCVRARRDEQVSSLDFLTIVPMPESIARTRGDNSHIAHEQALRLTGYKDWYDWSLANWGVKWNCSEF